MQASTSLVQVSTGLPSKLGNYSGMECRGHLGSPIVVMQYVQQHRGNCIDVGCLEKKTRLAMRDQFRVPFDGRGSNWNAAGAGLDDRHAERFGKRRLNTEGRAGNDTGYLRGLLIDQETHRLSQAKRHDPGFQGDTLVAIHADHDEAEIGEDVRHA